MKPPDEKDHPRVAVKGEFEPVPRMHRGSRYVNTICDEWRAEMLALIAAMRELHERRKLR